MELVKEYKFKLNSLWAILSQLIPVLVTVLLILINSNDLFMELLGVSFILYISRYPHEYFHMLGAYLVGIEAEVNFKKINPTCTPKGPMNYKQFAFFSLLPALSLTLIYALVSLIAYLLSFYYLSHTFLLILVLSIATYAGDFGYILNAVRYKECTFVDKGDTLEIYKDYNNLNL